MDIREFEDRLRVNRDDLDTELAEQPELFYLVARRARELAVERDSAKDSIREVSAEVAVELRATAEEDGERVTEGKINERVLAHERVVSAQQKYRDLCAETVRWSALEDSFKDKSFAMRGLVDLFSANYYQTDRAGPGGPGRSVAEYERGRDALAKAREERSGKKVLKKRKTKKG